MFWTEFNAQEGSWVKTFVRPRLLLLLAALTPVILALQPASTNAQTKGERPLRRAPAYVSEKEKMNAWTVGLAGGLLEGAPQRRDGWIVRRAEGRRPNESRRDPPICCI